MERSKAKEILKPKGHGRQWSWPLEHEVELESIVEAEVPRDLKGKDNVR